MKISRCEYVQLEIPNTQVLDSAEQFYGGALHLKNLPALSGVLLPQLANAALAIELYAKSLNTWRVIPKYENLGNGAFGGEVKGFPKSYGHEISKILQDYDADLISDINELHSEGELPVSHIGLIGRLKIYDKFFIDVRYSYENDSLEGINLEDLWDSVELIRKVVRTVRPILKLIK